MTVLLLGQTLASLDTSIVNVATTAIRHDLRISGALLQLVVSGYVLAYAAVLVTGARLGDDHGHRRLFRIGLAGFTASSLVCSVAPAALVLVVARFVQGASAGLMLPQILSIIQLRFEGTDRARALGLYSLVLAVGVALGLVLGGLLIALDLIGLSWRPVFLVNVPIGLLLVVLSGRVLPDTRSAVRRVLDIPGMLVLSVAMLLLVLPLTLGREAGWPVWTWPSLAAGTLMLAGLVALERSIAQGGGSPVIDPAAVATNGVKAGMAVAFVLMGGYGAFIFAVSLHLQSSLGFSPLAAGLTFALYALGFAAVNLNWARLPTHLQRWVPTAGLIVLAASDIAFAAVVARGGWSWVAVALLAVAGVGHGAGFGPLLNQIAARVRPEHAHAVSGLLPTLVQLSIAIGVAVLGSVYLAQAAAGAPGRGLALVSLLIAAATLAALAGTVRLASPAR